MDFISEKEAVEKGLTPFTKWLFDNDEERRVCKVWYTQIRMNKGRVAEYVRDKLGSRIAVFSNKIRA